MKVTFRVTAAQANTIRPMIAEGLAHNAYLSEGHFPFNSNQYVSLTGNVLTVEGERCALWQGGFQDILNLVKKWGLAPLFYETSVKELKWFDTMADYLCRLPLIEKIRAAGAVGGAAATVVFWQIHDSAEMKKIIGVAEMAPIKRASSFNREEIMEALEAFNAFVALKQMEEGRYFRSGTTPTWRKI